MIVYTGNGPMAFAAVLIVIVLAVPCVLLDNWYGPHPVLTALRTGGILTGLALAGLWCWKIGRRWNRDANLHTVYGIPLQYFAFAYWGFGVYLAVTLALKWFGGGAAE
jgi:hypothetical protein